MLKQATVLQVRNGDLPRDTSHLVLAMRRYPRGLKKERADEFRSLLAPDMELFTDWRNACATFDPNTAFQHVNYEARFYLLPDALSALESYSKMSTLKDVYLVCQCARGNLCHRELLLMTARALFGAQTDELLNSYPLFSRRLAMGPPIHSFIAQ